MKEETRVSYHSYGVKLLNGSNNLRACPVKEFVSDSEADEYLADKCSEADGKETEEE